MSTNTEATKPYLDIKKSLADIRAGYAEAPGNRRFHGLVIGEKGAGKTSLIGTCPKPVFIHSFDPGGTEVLSGMIEKDEIFVDRTCELEDAQNPTAYKHWYEDFHKKRQEGFFEGIATYALDSTTMMTECILNQLLKTQSRSYPRSPVAALDDAKMGMRQQDWQTFLNQWNMISRSVAALPCHTILLGHVYRHIDTATSDVVKTILLPGQSADKVPAMFHEFYALKVTGDRKRKLLTDYADKFQASTRMGSKKFQLEEEPDIRALLKKAGYPHEDAPGRGEVWGLKE